MLMELRGNDLLIRDAGDHFATIRAWGIMQWDRSAQMLKGPATLELLDNLAGIVRLPTSVEARRQSLRNIQAAVERERMNPDPRPMVPAQVKISLYAHQVRAMNMAALTFGWTGQSGRPIEKEGFGLLFEMGTGKTLTAIAIAGAGFKAGKINRVLIVAPTSVVPVWPREFRQYAAFPFTIRALLGEKKKRLEALDDLARFRGPHMRVAVINYESAWRDEILKALKDFNADLVIADESQRIKTHNAAQSKALHVLGDKAHYKLILSGTPVQNEAIDLFSQYRFLDRSVFGTNFYAFRSRYCRMGGFNNRQIIGYFNLEELIRREYSIAYRVTKADALDLPEQTFEDRYVSLPKKEMAAYVQLRRNSFVEISNGEKVTATTVLTKLLRLQQFTGGFLTTDDGGGPQLVSRAKLDALEDILRDYVVEARKKLVIFARFLLEVHEIERLSEKILKPAGMEHVAIYGEIRKEDRGTIVDRFQGDPKVMVFIGQIDTAGTGITLTAADTCVYYSVNFNYATYSQSLSRIHRLGQRNVCTYIHILAEGTIDATVLKTLRKKEDLAKSVVDSWHDILGDPNEEGEDE